MKITRRSSLDSEKSNEKKTVCSYCSYSKAYLKIILGTNFLSYLC